MKIITAMNGERLKLTATRLIELDHSDSTHPFYVSTADLKTALDRFTNFGFKTILVRGRAYDGEVHRVHVSFSPVEGRIGCKEFAPATFNLILRTMGLKKKAVAKKKASGRRPHTHKCPKCDKRVICNDHWCDRKKKYCKLHRVI